MLGISRGTLSRIEKGERPFSLGLALDLSDVLEMTIDDLISREGDP